MNFEYLIDSHCHIYYEPFDEDRNEMMQRADDAQVKYFLLPNVDLESLPLIDKICMEHKNNCFPMLGLHPCSVKADVELVLKKLEHLLFQESPSDDKKNWIAVGEIGLDYFWDISFKSLQIEAFRRQIAWAKMLHLPVVIHARDSLDDVLQILEELQDGTLRGVLHCFTGTKEQAQRGIDIGFYLGIGGVVTFKNAGLDKVVQDISLQHILLETDAPYLAPVPFRGKRNESAYLKIIAEKLSQIKGEKIEEVMRITTQNCVTLFKLKL